jgi:hypothetical protein
VRPDGAPLVLEVPRPRGEAATWRIASELWQASGARALYVATEAPGSDADLAPELATPLQALHQAASEALAGERDPLIVQLRGFAEPVSAQRVVVLDRQQRARATRPARLASLLTLLGSAAETRFFDGSSELLSLAGNANPQLHYSGVVGAVPGALLWLSESARRPYFERDGAGVAERLGAVGIAASTRTAAELLAEPVATAGIERARFDALLTLARSYAATENVQTLRQLVASLPREVRFAAGHADDLQQPYLFLSTHDGERVLRALVLPGGRGTVELRGQGQGVAKALLARPALVLVTEPEAVL